MAKADYLPPADGDLVIWHDRFKTAATGIGATLGILAGDLTEITNDNTNLRAKVTAAATATAAAQQAAREKQTMRSHRGQLPTVDKTNHREPRLKLEMDADGTRRTYRIPRTTRYRYCLAAFL